MGANLRGFQIKRSSVQRLTPSMRTALVDLGLRRIDVIYVSNENCLLAENIQAVPLHKIITVCCRPHKRASGFHMFLPSAQISATQWQGKLRLGSLMALALGSETLPPAGSRQCTESYRMRGAHTGSKPPQDSWTKPAGSHSIRWCLTPHDARMP